MGKKSDDKRLQAEFGRLILSSRKQKNLTQESLSELTGITDVYLRDLEHGNYTATWVIWLRLCTILNINISEFQEKYIAPELCEAMKKQCV